MLVGASRDILDTAGHQTNLGAHRLSLRRVWQRFHNKQAVISKNNRGLKQELHSKISHHYHLKMWFQSINKMYENGSNYQTEFSHTIMKRSTIRENVSLMLKGFRVRSASVPAQTTQVSMKTSWFAVTGPVLTSLSVAHHQTFLFCKGIHGGRQADNPPCGSRGND